MADVIIVHQFEILIIIVFGMHISFIILQVSTIMEVPLPTVVLKWNATDKIWDFSTTGVAIWMIKV